MRRRGAPLAGVLLAVSVTAGCTPGAAGNALAGKSCAHVVAGLAAYRRAVDAPTPSDQARYEGIALVQLEKALPFASQAAEADGKWQALMTTLQDVNRVPIGRLVAALEVQCNAAPGHQAH